MQDLIDQLFKLLKPDVRMAKISNINHMICCKRCINEITVLTEYHLRVTIDSINIFANSKHANLLIRDNHISLPLTCGCVIRQILCSTCFLFLGSTKQGRENCECIHKFNDCKYLFDFQNIVLINIIE